MGASGPFAAHRPSPPQMLLENQGLLGNGGQNKAGQKGIVGFRPFPLGSNMRRAFQLSRSDPDSGQGARGPGCHPRASWSSELGEWTPWMPAPCGRSASYLVWLLEDRLSQGCPLHPATAKAPPQLPSSFISRALAAFSAVFRQSWARLSI